MPQVSEEEKKRQEEELLAKSDLAEEDRRRIKRRASNRESARRTRQKRTEKLKECEERCAFLRIENAKIIQQLHELEKLYFDAVLQNRNIKSDISVIRTANPHLNSICPPAVTNPQTIPLPTSAPFTADLFAASATPASVPASDPAMLGAESTSMASMLASIPGVLPLDLAKFSASMAEQALQPGAPLALGEAGSLGIPGFPSASAFQDLMDATKHASAGAVPTNFTSLLQQPAAGEHGNALNLAPLMHPNMMLYPPASGASAEMKPPEGTHISAAPNSMPLLPEAPALDNLSAAPQIPPANFPVPEYPMPMAGQALTGDDNVQVPASGA